MAFRATAKDRCIPRFNREIFALTIIGHATSLHFLFFTPCPSPFWARMASSHKAPVAELLTQVCPYEASWKGYLRILTVLRVAGLLIRVSKHRGRTLVDSSILRHSPNRSDPRP